LRGPALEAGQDDRPAPPDGAGRVEDRRGRDGGQVKDDIDAVAAGQLANPGDGVLLLHVDDGVRAELPGQLQLPAVPGQAGGDDEARADVPGGEDRR